MTNLSSSHQPATYKIGYGDYLRFRDLIMTYSGLHFPERKRLDLEAGLFKALGETKATFLDTTQILDDYYRLLANQNDPQGRVELERLVNLLTVGETHFFRDEAQFDALWQHVLPELIAHKRRAAQAAGVGIQPQLRLWSAGCASGEEAYSLAISLKELIPDIKQWHILILATDINQDSLVRAREGIYSDWSFRENRAKFLRPRYFSLETGSQSSNRNRYRLDPAIKQMVSFASLNLINDEYPAISNNTANMDLIICRNVTIYFTQEDTQKIINQFYQTLIDGGWLVVGHSEPTFYVYREFQAQSFPGTLLYQKTGRPQSWPEGWNWQAVSEQKPVEAKNRPLVTSVPGPVSQKAVGNPQTGPVKTRPLASSQASSCPEMKLSSPPEPYQFALKLLDQGQVAKAIDQLQQILATQPNFAPAHYLLGRAYANLGNWFEARRWCRSALTLDNLLAEAYHVMALTYQHEGDLMQAAITLKKAVYLDRNNPIYHFNLAVLYQKLDDPITTQRSLENTLRLLCQYAPTDVLPGADGATAGHLRQVVEKMLPRNKTGR